MNQSITLLLPPSKNYTIISLSTLSCYNTEINLEKCLEHICDFMISRLVSSNNQKNWKSYPLIKKIEVSKEQLNKRVVSRLVNNIALYSLITNDHVTMDIFPFVKDYVLSYILAYFKLYGMDQEGRIMWIPTIFRLLPPKYKITILEEYYKHLSTYAVINELATEYLKNNQKEKALLFLEKCYKKNELLRSDVRQIQRWLLLLEFRLEPFDENEKIEMSKKQFFHLLEDIPPVERSPYVFLMSILLNT